MENVVTVGWGTYLNAAPNIYSSSKDDLNKSFWENIHFAIGVGMV